MLHYCNKCRLGVATKSPAKLVPDRRCSDQILVQHPLLRCLMVTQETRDPGNRLDLCHKDKHWKTVKPRCMRKTTENGSVATTSLTSSRRLDTLPVSRLF